MDPDKCFFCGRNSKFFNDYFSPLITQIDEEIKQAKKDSEKEVKDLNNKKNDYLKKILDELNNAAILTENNQYLDFKIGTIRSDSQNFSKLIPELKTFLKYCENDGQTINDLRNKFIQSKNDLNLGQIPLLIKKFYEKDILQLEQKSQENKQQLEQLIKEKTKKKTEFKSFLKNMFSESKIELTELKQNQIILKINICAICKNSIESKSRRDLAFMIKKYVNSPDKEDCDFENANFASSIKRKDY